MWLRSAPRQTTPTRSPSSSAAMAGNAKRKPHERKKNGNGCLRQIVAIHIKAAKSIATINHRFSLSARSALGTHMTKPSTVTMNKTLDNTYSATEACQPGVPAGA